MAGRPNAVWHAPRPWGAAAIAAAALLFPAVASAHKSPPLSTDFEARIAGLRPPAPGVHAQVLDGDQRLRIDVAEDRVVVVLGVEGEPFLRFSSVGVEANLASPTAASARVIDGDDAVASSGVRWRRVRRGHAFAWHEGRLRPLQAVPGSSASSREVASWSIPLLVDGRRVVIAGSEWHAGGPSGWPWLIAGTLVLAAAGLVARLLSRGAQRAVATVLLPVSLAALIAGWLGILFPDGVTPVGASLALAAAGACIAAVGALLAAVHGTSRLGAMALIGVLVATFALPEFSVFTHGYVLSALPETAARAVAEAAIVVGGAVAIVCVPAMAELFDQIDGSRPTERSPG